MKQYFPELINKDILSKNKLVLNYVKKITKKINHEFFNEKNFGINKKEINFFFNKKLFESFDFKQNKFEKKISIYALPKFIIYYFIYTASIIIFKNRKKIREKKYKLMIDHIESEAEIKLYEKLITLFKNENILIRKVNRNVKDKRALFFPRIKNYLIKKKEIYIILKLFSISIILSFKNRMNFLYLALKLIDDCLYYQTLFKKIKTENIIMHQHYYSNNIKNYFFKKNGGKKSCLIQKNINTKNTNGFFYHGDIMFSIGKRVNISNKKTYSEINRNINVGSFMTNNKINLNFNKKKLSKDIDVLYVAGNGLFNNSYYDVYETYKADYIEHLNWLAKISLKFPKIKVRFKHHSNNYANDENKILKDSNVKFINQLKNSYELCFRAKFVCSWASTMIIENKPKNFYSYFLDPGRKNHQFLIDIKNRKNISINSYEKFELKVMESLRKIYVKRSDSKYCNHETNTNKEIFNNL